MIDGNTTMELQACDGAKNPIGEYVTKWTTNVTLKGWLDYLTGEAKSTYSAKMQESTHVFICDYMELTGITPENSRAIINGETYDVILIDDPMGLHQHYEILLRYLGGQNNGK